ncbi:Carbamoyl-phosphate synthase small chain [Anaerohalosphaera lusitana]|uniref:Carbamoyl phosphate synthase small chain n=1 Tax=Anaerohalosphaera lusitana TaxID=1936003 RepID=A0A1U9NPB2_9BACT|nr:glutamine-hydrolyzing carbamoyl-phosphate synthase small subunit [Anaerohalosphaera lusitana]AQT69346.1 Carbamoyl-phosphate synthase small chain [Anaerohalosphaera lusitana]
MKAILLLEDGRVFEGRGFGAKGTTCGEVVFNTSMAGYQEILTDPSYNEQIITMTYPQIGNYGTNDNDWESDRVQVAGFIVKENCDYPSNWRSNRSLSDYLKKNKIVGLEGIDTRALVKHIREKGAMRGVISSAELNVQKLQAKLDKYPGLVGRDIVKNATISKPFVWKEGLWDVEADKPEDTGKPKYKVVAYDFGMKHNILRNLASRGCEVHVVPADTPAGRIMQRKPHGIFLSNGPGDPAAVAYAVENIKKLLGKAPIFGICLGHQLLSLALGGTTYKLKFGHRGANHPVKNLRTKEIEITSQNHGFCADLESLKETDVELTHMNLNDNTLEGIYSKKLGAFSVQYHPEASPGPHDASYLFEEFTRLMDEWKKKK